MRTTNKSNRNRPLVPACLLLAAGGLAGSAPAAVMVHLKLVEAGTQKTIPGMVRITRAGTDQTFLANANCFL